MRDREAAERWIRAHVEPTGPLAIARERPWSTVLQVPVTEGVLWFKACNPVQAFEPRLTAELSVRWPGHVVEVVAFDERRAWLLLADAGTPLRDLRSSPDVWLEVLPMYAELQRGEAAYAEDHLARGVPSLVVPVLAGRYADLLGDDLPLEPSELAALRTFAPRFQELSDELATAELPATIQHDDLHAGNVYMRDGRLRVLDWGDSSISHPFFSLVVTFRMLEEWNGVNPDDPLLARLRDAYLGPWGDGMSETFELRYGSAALRTPSPGRGSASSSRLLTGSGSTAGLPTSSAALFRRSDNCSRAGKGCPQMRRTRRGGQTSRFQREDQMPVKSDKPTRKRASSPKKTTAKAAVPTADRPVEHDEIARRAYFIYLEEGHSDELDNWLRAERELVAAV